MNILAKITNLGVTQILDEETVKRVRIVNQISFSLIVLSIIQLLVALLFDFPGIAVVLFLAVSFFSPIPPLLNGFGMTIASRVISLCSSYVFLLSQIIVFGPELHIQFFLLGLVGGPLLLFDKEIGIWKWGMVFTPVLLWLYLEWHFVNIPPFVSLNPDSIFWPRIAQNLLLFGLMVFLFFTFTQQSNKQIKNIEQQRLAIETLLREIHHRVKNNLQVITSLLGLQSMGIKEQKIKNLFQDLQHRINSMALSHEMLYQTDDLTRINYETYIRKLITGLINSMKGAEHAIHIQLNIKKVYLNIDTAIPLGLIINEVVTNSLKYAFSSDQGTITIHLRKLNHPYFLLEIGDNGVGYPNMETKAKRTSLGLTLIQKLTNQLKGNVVRDSSKNGTNYVIHFQEIISNS